MIFELVYTSAPQGLFPGNTGFAVVGCTRNMDYAVCEQLENLSAYTPHYPHYDSNAWNNPVNYAHRIIQVNGIEYHILSRICFNGLDYTQRSNKLASHIAISADELQSLPSGPASVFFQETLFKNERWQIKTEYFENPPVVMDLKYELDVCKNWKQSTGDAGWAGVIAESYLSNPQKNIYIVFDPQRANQNVSLMAEVLSLLPVHLRWKMTFSTYFTELPAGVTCNVRFCLPSCEALLKAKQNPAGNLIIDLTAPMAQAIGGDLVVAARTGKRPEPRVAASNIPVNSLSPFSVPAQPQIIVQQNNGIKAAMIVAFIALGILGIIFLITKITDNNKIQNTQQQSTKNKNLAEQAARGYHGSLQIRIDYMKKVAQVTLKSPILTAELREKVDDIIKNTKLDKKGKLPKKALTEILNIYNQIDKKLSAQQALLAELNQIVEIAKQEQNLVQDIKEYESLSGQLGANTASRLSYTPQINLGEIKALISMMQEDAKKLAESQDALRKQFPTVKFPARKNTNISNGIRTVSVSQAWSGQKDLWNALKNNKAYSVAFNDLIPDATIKTVYWGNSSMKKEGDAYIFTINGKALKLKISLKNGVLHIQRMDKNAIDITEEEFAIQLKGKEEKDNQWLYFFIGPDTKLPFSDAIYFSVNAEKLLWRFPMPEEVKMFPASATDITAVLVIGDKGFNLKLNKHFWEPAEDLPIPDAVKNLIKQWNSIAQLQAKLQKDIASKIFSPEIELTDAFKEYDKSPKKATDIQDFLNALLEDTTIKALGLQGKLKGYEDMTIAQAKEAVEKKISDELAKAWGGKVQIRFEVKSLPWQQQVEVKHFMGDKQ